MYDQTLVDCCSKISPIKLSVTKTPEELVFKNQLFESTKFLNVLTPPLKLRYFCVLNSVKEIPKCICGSPVTYNKAYPDKGFAQFCGPLCSRANKDKNKDYQKYLNDKDWLYEQRITLGKSKEQIAKELGCSIVPITKRLEEFNIEHRKTGIKNTKIEIPNKYELIKMYFDDGLTLTEIGKKYDASNITAKKWFDHYNIELLSHSNVIKTKAIPKIVDINIKRYGVKHIFSLPEIKEKIKNVFIKKYGVPYHPINNSSNAELELLDYFNSLSPGFSKSRIYGIELDGYNSNINFAFEYCGLFWHQEKIKGKNLHQKKYEICKNNNIRLLTIFEDEFLHKKELVKNKIKHILGYNNEHKIYARKCKISIIQKEIRQRFFNKYHIQGDGFGSINIGLYYNNDLVAGMSFIKRTENDIELTRYATSCNVIGGFGKLLNHFKNYYDWTNIITFADLRWHTGEMYKKFGFISEKTLIPSYEYVINGKRIHKFNFRKEQIQNRFPELYDQNESESQNMDRIGIPRIYDCGKIKFVLKKGSENPFLY